VTPFIRITTLVDNTAGDNGTLGEHGLAMWIEANGYRLLFDTGQARALICNADALGIDLACTDAIVLSHGHYDHVGGLEACRARAPGAVVYAHTEAFASKYVRRHGDRYEDIGFGSAATPETMRWLQQAARPTDRPTRLAEAIYVTGAIPRITDYEDVGGPFFLDSAGAEPDPLIDDQAVFLETVHGIVVLLGCAHAGIINTLRYVRHLTGGRPLHAVIGGMHLRSASEARLSRTVKALGELGVELLGPAHCTGVQPTKRLSAAFPGRCHPWKVGTSMSFEVHPARAMPAGTDTRFGIHGR